MGPVVDVLLEARPLALVETRVKIVPLGELESDLDFARKILRLRDDCDNMMVWIFFFFFEIVEFVFLRSFFFFSNTLAREKRVLISSRALFFATTRSKQKKLPQVLISLGGVAKTGSRVEVSPGFRPFAYVEMRTRRRGARKNARPLLNSLLVNWWLPEVVRRTKFGAFAQGSVPAWLLTLSRVPLFGRVLDGGAAAVAPRRFFVNRYGPATAGRPRLSFTYYELADFARFPEAVAALLSLARGFEGRTGWSPGALAVYFVRRGGDKETSNYSGPRGISCTLDPVTVREREREREIV